MDSRETGKQISGLARAYSLAIDLAVTLVVGTLVGGGLGYLLDRWWHTQPAMLLILGFLGFVGGMLQVVRTLTRPDSSPNQPDGKS